MSQLDQIFTPKILLLAAINLLVLILSICVHEFGHAVVADKLGDPLPRSQGRVTLNPLAHIDPIGTLLFPLIAFFAGAAGSSLGGRLIGWGKPVYTSPRSRFVRGGMKHKTADLLISLAGPMMNVLLAAITSVVFVVLLRLGMAEYDPERDIPLVAGVVGIAIRMNIALALFNLIPCPPLDGRSVLAWFFPEGHGAIAWLQRYGQMIFIALVLTGLLAFLMIPVRFLTDLWMSQLYKLAP